MNKIAKKVKISGASRKENLEGKLITKCCDLVESSIRMASHLLDAAHLEFEALLTVMVMVTASFLATASHVCKPKNGKSIIDVFCEEVKTQTEEFIKDDQKDINAN